MHRMIAVLLIGIGAFVVPTPLLAADADDPVHDELRRFRDRLVQAIVNDDIATQVELSHPDIVTMWQDGRVAAGHDGLAEFLEELGKGADRGFLGYTQEPTPATLTAVHEGRFGFVHGTSISQYELYGMQFELPNYWTATLLREDGQWRLIGYHVSGNIADNPFLDAAKQSVYFVGGIAGMGGLIVGSLLGRMRPRRGQDAGAA
ncbi:MAG: nuclear transport factor 2 family protein [Phycisphaeraceae bacterium]